MKKTYFIAGMFWKQTELTFRENEQVREILKGKLSMNECTTEKLGMLVERLYEGGVLRELIPLILKPDHSNVFKRLWNIIICSFTGTSRTNVLERMTDSDIAKVMLDFFVFKTLWLQRLLNITTGSGLSLSMKLRAWKNKVVKKFSTTSAMATSHD